jgi:hypothetical protein
VLVPPSTVTTEAHSGIYRWERRTAPTARLDWQAATNLLRPPQLEPIVGSAPGRPVRRRGDVHTLAAAVAREREGNRNRLLFWAFCEAMRSGYDPRPIAEAGLRCGQTVREVEATWRQAVKRISADGQAHPSPAGSASDRPTRTAAVVRTF